MKISTYKKGLMLVGGLALAIASCVTIESLEQPHEVMAGEEFTVKAKIVADADNGPTSEHNWANWGIRVPEDWEVTCPENSYEYYYDGMLKSTLAMIPNPMFTELLNVRYPKEGYKWLGFSTGYDTERHYAGTEWVPDAIEGAERQNVTLRKDNPGDYVLINAKVKAGTKVGDYQLEYVFGYEEQSYYQYSENGYVFDPNVDPALTDVGTFQLDGTQENQINDKGETKSSIRNLSQHDTKITVKEAEVAIDKISADEFSITGAQGGIRVNALTAATANAIVTVYDLQGRQLDCRAITGGTTMLKAAKGVNVVEIVKGNRKTVKKVVVK